jgi:hypothetical protein
MSVHKVRCGLLELLTIDGRQTQEKQSDVGTNSGTRGVRERGRRREVGKSVGTRNWWTCCCVGDDGYLFRSHQNTFSSNKMGS